MEYLNGWKKDRWSVTQPGNEKKFYGEHENGNMIWVYPGGRWGDYGVKIGTSTKIGDSCHVASRLPNEEAAEREVQKFIERENNPKCPVYRVYKGSK